MTPMNRLCCIAQTMKVTGDDDVMICSGCHTEYKRAPYVMGAPEAWIVTKEGDGTQPVDTYARKYNDDSLF